MATWDEVRDHLRAQMKLDRDDPSGCSIVCPIRVGEHDVLQAIGLAPTEFHQRPWLQIIGDLFAEAGLSARGGLVYADRLPFGAIVLRNDRFLLRYGVAFDVLRLADLDWTLRVFAYEAVRLRVNLLGPSRGFASDAFGNYAE